MTLRQPGFFYGHKQNKYLAKLSLKFCEHVFTFCSCCVTIAILRIGYIENSLRSSKWND